MALQYLPIAIFLALVVLTFRPANGDVYFVAPNVADCQNASCRTLNYYANSTSEKYLNSVFYFMSGTHLLQQTWVIDHASNLTLTGRLPNSEADEEVIVECTNSSTDQGIQVINGRNITLKYMAIFNCQQRTYIIAPSSSALFCSYTNSLQLSNVAIRFTKGSCLQLIFCTEYVITDSVFTNATNDKYTGHGILAQGFSSGKLTSIKLLNNDYGITVYDPTENVTTVQMDWIYASHNKMFDFWFDVCSANMSLRNSRSLDSGGFFANKSCIFPQIYRIEIQNCSFGALKHGIVMFVSQAQYLEIIINSSSISDSSGDSFLVGLEWYPGIAIINNRHSNGIEQDESKFIIQHVTIENVHVPDNSVPVLFMYAVPLLEITDVSVLNNGHGGLVLYDCVAVFRGTNTFSNNSAIYGGGMALYANSYILLEPNTTLDFVDNKAVKFGGGIFVSQDDTWPWINLCFVDLADSSRLHFNGNEAKYTGNTLYGGKIETCLKQDYHDANLTEVFGFLRNATPCVQTNVSSDAVRLVFCDNSCIDTATTEKSVSVYPGGSLNERIAAIGQLNGLTQANVVLHYDEVFDHHTQDETEFINVTCTNITRDIRVSRTDTQANIVLTLSNDYDPYSLNENITIAVELKPCPAGFDLSQDKNICDCCNSIKENAHCNITSENITRIDTPISWIYPTEECIVFSKHCPFDYCNNVTFSVESPDDQCDHNRTGILCGDCKEGFSMSLGSNECWDCRDQFWQLPVIILGSALAGIVLVAVLIVLNLTVSVGTINGLLFFANVVKIYDTLLPGELCQFCPWFYSWMNLDLGIRTCLFDRMDACQKLGLQFVFPIYLLILVMAIVAVCRCGQWIGFRSLPWLVKLSDKTALLMGPKIIPVLATLILISYTKQILNIALIYLRADVKVCDCNNTECTSDCFNNSRWYVNGSVMYLEGCHKLIFGWGIFLAVPLISFTLFLMLFPLMERSLPRFKFWSSSHMRLKPWYDAFGGPYKDGCRHWIGVFLFLRCVLVFQVTVSKDSNIAASSVVWQSLVLIPIVAFFQIYKLRILNVLEIFYLSILAVVFSEASRVPIQRCLLLSIPPCLLVAILMFHIYQRVKSTRLALFLLKLVKDIKRNRSGNERMYSANKSKDGDETSLSANTASIVSLDELREPLMENSNI